MIYCILISGPRESARSDAKRVPVGVAPLFNPKHQAKKMGSQRVRYVTLKDVFEPYLLAPSVRNAPHEMAPLERARARASGQGQTSKDSGWTFPWQAFPRTVEVG